jgi:carbonic anhydrase
VHRNIANVITVTDPSSSSVIEFAVTHLGVKHVVVCGHTKCGGAKAALGDADLGPALNGWLEPVRELRKKNKETLDKIADADGKAKRLAEINVQRSLEEVKKHPAVQKAIAEKGLEVHGVMYDVPTASLSNLPE